MTGLPAAVRGRVVAEALRRREPSVPTGPHARAFAEAFTALDALLRDLSSEEWATQVIHDWDVQQTVVHLMAGDGAVCAAAGVPEAIRLPPYEGPFASMAQFGGPVGEWEGRSRYIMARHHGRPYRMSWHAWRAQARSLLKSRASRERDDAPVEYAGRTLALADAYLARGFETWLHADDIGRAVGRPFPEPSPESMEHLVELGFATLGLLESEVAAKLVVDGPGGATVSLGAGEPKAELRLSSTDFCRLLGGNRRPDETEVEVQGDPDTANAALIAVASLAIL
ncbi:maleylpyruvate isomerase family mycothiol-dependent enzyme [Yinghuangia sp. YIM S09857]|uniref:maleylpyruvate isomerase family mycothiol-dependent enzyme n=1 Tax=Yinghuangia sp. YIM S09857 TaxID=3436929 RepID=UPI003F52A481